MRTPMETFPFFAANVTEFGAAVTAVSRVSRPSGRSPPSHVSKLGGVYRNIESLRT